MSVLGGGGSASSSGRHERSAAQPSDPVELAPQLTSPVGAQRRKRVVT